MFLCIIYLYQNLLNRSYLISLSKDKLHNEQELLLRIAAGDEKAFQQIAYKYSSKLFFHSLTFVKDWHKAEEITQDILLHIWHKRDKLSSVSDLDNYIYILSKNFLLSFLRKNVPNFYPTELDTVSKLIQSTAAEYENKELAVLLEKAINHLPEQKKQVFRLVHQEGLTQAQVSLKLGIAERTVRWNLVSATNGIKDFLHRYSTGELWLLLCLVSNFF
jgi:RNA polymerase sigma factor (sigma-70 family)